MGYRSLQTSLSGIIQYLVRFEIPTVKKNLITVEDVNPIWLSS